MPREATRAAEIRAAALELFVRSGYEATTMGEIGDAVGIRGPSLYKHVTSKQELLASIIVETMTQLLGRHRTAIDHTEDPVERLRRAVEAHVRYHARYRREAFVGNRELRSLVQPHRSKVMSHRAEYARCFESLIEVGASCGVFTVTSVQLSAYAILDLGMGVAVWFREETGPSEDEVAWQYADFALRLVGSNRLGPRGLAGS